MPEIPGQSVPATGPRAHLHARLLAIQIQRGLTLVRRLEARGDETVAHDYQAWREHNERLLRLLIASHEVWESYLRTICSSYGRRTPLSAGLIEARPRSGTWFPLRTAWGSRRRSRRLPSPR